MKVTSKNTRIVSDHPLLLDMLTKLRRDSTDSVTFRLFTKQITNFLIYESTLSLKTQKIITETPLTKLDGDQLDESMVIVPILRAGLLMAEAAAEILSEASVVHIGISRDEITLRPKEYFIPDIPVSRASTCLILDPMLATGGTASAACDVVKSWDVEKIIFVGILGSEQGVSRLTQEHPDVEIHLGAIDSDLDENGFIVPGLGDAGDRLFSTY
jgi:uracil phosphoribosyltransferase